MNKITIAAIIEAIENQETLEKAGIILVRSKNELTLNFVLMAQKLVYAAAMNVKVFIKTDPSPLLDAFETKPEFVYHFGFEK